MGASASPLCTVPVPQCKFPLHSCNDNAHCQDPCPGSPSSARETTIRHGPHPSRARPPPLPCWPTVESASPVSGDFIRAASHC